MELPDDLVEEIVRRLPGESMLHFRRVSKSWRRMIDSFKFKPRAILLDRLASIAFQSSTDNYTNDIVFKKLKTPFPSTAQVIIKGSVNGLLLLLVHGEKSIFIWNPFTGNNINVPTIFDPELHWLEGVGFSYNPDTDDYTVVVAVTERWNRERVYRQDCSYVMAASLRTMEWKEVRFDRYHIRSIRDYDGAVVEGHLHWRVKKREAVSVLHTIYENSYETIVYFDAITNEFQEVPLPELGKDVTIERLCVLRGCLCIICCKLPLGGTGELKAMTKYGDTESWTTLITLSRANLHSCISFSPLCFGEEVLIQIGDENFIIAALMAMRHPKSIVLSGALSALYVMTILSTGLGRIVPNLISRKHTNSAATVLYAFFGLRLLYIAWRSDSKASSKKEMEEVEEKLESNQGKTSVRRFFSRFCTPIFLESFILTFLAEWGDRSQIATIALATHKHALGVAVGASIGHTICTSLAVIGGSILASKISQGTVATVGGLLFLGFSLSSYFYPPL